MSRRDQLIEEIVQEFRFDFAVMLERAGREDGESTEEWDSRIEHFLRTSLLRISDASMDAVEVEEKIPKLYSEGGNDEDYNVCLIHNAAIAAIEEKRRLFTK